MVAGNHQWQVSQLQRFKPDARKKIHQMSNAVLYGPLRLQNLHPLSPLDLAKQNHGCPDPALPAVLPLAGGWAGK